MRSILGRALLLAVLPALLHVCTAAVAAPSLPTTTSGPQIQVDSPQSMDAQIAGEVTRLGDPDPAVRRKAGEALVQFGAAARPAVLAASRGDDPQIADASQQVLRALPWWLPDDPARVKEQLQTYGQASVADRIGIVAQLAGVPRSQPALLRLLSDEPNEDICWQIEVQLIGQPDMQTLIAARRFDLQTARPAALVLSARAWLTPLTGGRSAMLVDRDKALSMLHRAVELEAVTPTYDDGQLDFAFDELTGSAVERHQYDEAAELRRQQCKRIGVTRSSFPAPFFELLLLHADYGPLAGFGDDLQTYPSFSASPESLFILSRLYAREGQTLMAQTMVQAALAASTSQESRSGATDFLINHGWAGLASKECRATLARADAVQDPDDVGARWRLSTLDASLGNDALAADQLRIALGDPRNFSLEAGAQRAMQIELSLHGLRAARAKGDAAQAAREVDQLMSVGANNEDAVIDLVPELKGRGNGEAAERLFRGAYEPLKTQIDAGNADPMLLNDLAWLCARCGEHLDEALDLSNRAVAAEPQNSAYLDTNAEAHFRTGHAADAVRLETMALKIQPGDPFMEGQLKRFQTGTVSATKPGEH